MWRPIDITEVRLTPAELAMMQSIQDSTTVGAEKLNSVVGEFLETIAAAGTALGAAGEIPDLVRMHVVNRTRWLWLCEFPALKSFQTEARSKLNDAAEKMLADISSRDVKIPNGDGSSAASADQFPRPTFGTRGGTRDTDPPLRHFTSKSQNGI